MANNNKNNNNNAKIFNNDMIQKNDFDIIFKQHPEYIPVTKDFINTYGAPAHCKLVALAELLVELGSDISELSRETIYDMLYEGTNHARPISNGN